MHDKRTGVRLRAGVLALLLVMGAACSGSDSENADTSTTEAGGSRSGEGEAVGSSSIVVEEVPGLGIDLEPAEPTAWTYLIYSLSDTDLEPFMLADLIEASEVGSGDEVNIIALVDREEGYTDESLVNLDDFTTAKVLYVGAQEMEELGDLGEIDMADPHVLASFVEFGLNTFPADNYALTISDHGGGWTGIGPDHSSGEVLDLSEIASALDAGLAVTDEERIDLLGFDACLMATYEVASTLAPYADFMLASEELEPGHGWDYRSLQVLLDDPSTDAATLGSAFVQGFQGQAEEQGTGAEITLSLVDLAGMDALDAAIAEFAGVLAEQVDNLGPIIGQNLASNVSYGRNPDPSRSTHLTDLGALVSQIGVESLQVSDQADAVLRAINDAVLDQTVGPARLGSTGLSIYFPPVLELSSGAYQQIPVAEQWTNFLIAYYLSGAAIPPEGQPAIEGDNRARPPRPDRSGSVQLGEDTLASEPIFGEAVVEAVDGGVEVSVQLEPSAVPNIAEAYLSFGYVDPEDGAIVQLGDSTAEVGEDGLVSGFTDLTVLTMSDVDGDTIDAYLGLEANEDGSLLYATIPLDYSAEGSDEIQPVNLAVVVDAETGDVLQEVYYLIDEDAGSFGEMTADPEGLISPVVLVYEEDAEGEWQAFGDAALFADLPNLAYDFAPLDPGTEIYVDLTIVDYGGNTLIASNTFTL